MFLSTILDCASDDEGGALAIYFRGTAAIMGSDIANTYAKQRGGALRVYSQGDLCTLIVASSTITNVSATRGGAIHNDGGRVSMRECSVKYPTAQGHIQDSLDSGHVDDEQATGGTVNSDGGHISIEGSLIAHSFSWKDGGVMVLAQDCITAVVNSQIFHSCAHGQGGVVLAVSNGMPFETPSPGSG
eukprot:7385456-Prymnesium_polylepis.1